MTRVTPRTDEAPPPNSREAPREDLPEVKRTRRTAYASIALTFLGPLTVPEVIPRGFGPEVITVLLFLPGFLVAVAAVALSSRLPKEDQGPWPAASFYGNIALALLAYLLWIEPLSHMGL